MENMQFVNLKEKEEYSMLMILEFMVIVMILLPKIDNDSYYFMII